MKNKIIKLEKEKLVKQFRKNLRDEEPFFIIGKRDEDLKTDALEKEFFLLLLPIRNSTSRDGNRPGRKKLKKETDVLE